VSYYIIKLAFDLKFKNDIVQNNFGSVDVYFKKFVPMHDL